MWWVLYLAKNIYIKISNIQFYNNFTNGLLVFLCIFYLRENIPIGLSLASEVNLHTIESSTVDQSLNCDLHCSTATPDVHSTMQRLRTVHAAVTPTSVLPAPGQTHKKVTSCNILISVGVAHSKTKWKRSVSFSVPQNQGLVKSQI